jgi:hypothetical protein
VRRVAALGAALAVVLGGCGEAGKTDEQLVRDTLDAFGAATAAKDYQRLCDDLLAPALLESLVQIGLPCEIALQRSLEDTEEPKLAIGAIAVTGAKARAEVRTTAKGQPPSRDVVQLVRTDAGWRIASLGGQVPAAPSPPRQESSPPPAPPAPQPTVG